MMWLIARLWRVPLIALAITACWTLWVVLPDPIGVPGRSWLSEHLWPIAPALVAVSMTYSADVLLREPESIASRGALRLRIQHLVLSVAVVLMTVAPAIAVVDRATAAKNLTLLIGLGYALIAVFTIEVGLLALVVAPTTMWLVGSNGAGFPAATWALLLHAADPVGWIFAGVSLALGWGLFAAAPVALPWSRLSSPGIPTTKINAEPTSRPVSAGAIQPNQEPSSQVRGTSRG